MMLPCAVQKSRGSPVDIRGSTEPATLGAAVNAARDWPLARSRTWMDHGFAELRLAANSGAVVKGERSHASCLPSREKAGAESLPVEADGKVSTCVRRSKSARKLCSRWPVPRVLMKARRLPSGERVSDEARPWSKTSCVACVALGVSVSDQMERSRMKRVCDRLERKEEHGLALWARWGLAQRRERARSRAPGCVADAQDWPACRRGRPRWCV